MAEFSDLPPGATVVATPPPGGAPQYSDLPPGATVVSGPDMPSFTGVTSGASSTATPPPPPPGLVNYLTGPGSILGMTGQAAIGAAKGVGGTVAGLGKLVTRIPGVESLENRALGSAPGAPGIVSQAFNAAEEMLTPTNLAQTVGKTGEQIGEFTLANAAKAPAAIEALLQSSKAARIAAEAAKGAGVAAAQTGGAPVPTALGGVLGGVAGIPESGALQGSARNSMARALGAQSGEDLTTAAHEVAPQLLAEGGVPSLTRKSLQDKILTKFKDASDELDLALKGPPGARPVDKASLLDRIDELKKDFATEAPGASVQAPIKAADGNTKVFFSGDPLRPETIQKFAVTTPEAQAAIGRLQDLKSAVNLLGDNPTVKELNGLKSTWTSQVTNAGTNPLNRTLAEGQNLGMLRSGAQAIRNQIADVAPEITKLGKQQATYMRANEFLSDAKQRALTEGITAGKLSIASAPLWLVAHITNAIPHAISGEVNAGTAVLTGGLLARALTRSTAWNSLSAATKYKVAGMLAEGNTAGFVANALRVLAVGPIKNHAITPPPGAESLSLVGAPPPQ